jgi:hypothetical protein
MLAGRPNSTWGGGDGRGIRVVVADRETMVLITIMLLPKWSAFRAAGNRPEPEASMRKTGIRPVPWKGWDGTLSDGDEQGELGEHSRASRRDAAPDRLHQARLQQSYTVRSPGGGRHPDRAALSPIPCYQRNSCSAALSRSSEPAEILLINEPARRQQGAEQIAERQKAQDPDILEPMLAGAVNRRGLALSAGAIDPKLAAAKPLVAEHETGACLAGFEP